VAVAWTLQPSSGPFPAPWEGRDAIGWVWEVYSGDESRRVLVEVSGTAMSIADEYLPPETRLARATSGRSEVEKVLGQDEPPRRVSLGTTGYLGDLSAATRPDFLIRGRDGEFIAAVEVKNPDALTLPAAAVIRDRLAPPNQETTLQYILVVSQNRAYLYDTRANQYDPVAELPMFEVVESYYPLATEHQRFRGSELEILILEWLRDLTTGERAERAAEQELQAHGFLDAIRDGLVEVQPV
jgi:hypothetical protein